jgi:RHS repeat-associated protein
LQNRYIFGTGIDEALIQVSSGGTLTFLHADTVGSIVATSNDSGAVTNKNLFGPFGEIATLSGTTFGFTGQRYDSELGLYYFKNRYYSSIIGRFLQPDPVGYTGEDFNLYTYAFNSPLKNTDPMGEDCGCGCAGSTSCGFLGSGLTDTQALQWMFIFAADNPGVSPITVLWEFVENFVYGFAGSDGSGVGSSSSSAGVVSNPTNFKPKCKQGKTRNWCFQWCINTACCLAAEATCKLACSDFYIPGSSLWIDCQLCCGNVGTSCTIGKKPWDPQNWLDCLSLTEDPQNIIGYAPGGRISLGGGLYF